jgi:hypothetical protein
MDAPNPSNVASNSRSIAPPPPLDGFLIVTVVAAELEPPGPVQVRVNLLSTVKGPTLCVPDVALDPVHPSEATQLVAPVAVQLSVADSPDLIDTGLAVITTTGAGGVVSTLRP